MDVWGIGQEQGPGKLLAQSSHREHLAPTPVINSLDEAVSLLEMVTGHEYPDLDTRPKVSSALAIHEQLVIHGVRYVPRYEMLVRSTGKTSLVSIYSKSAS
jgi:hypothetical protein